MEDRVSDDPRCNVVLERLLGRAGWTPENLGDHLNRLATTLGLKVHVHRRYPRRWVYAEKDRARGSPETRCRPWCAYSCTSAWGNR